MAQAQCRVGGGVCDVRNQQRQHFGFLEDQQIISQMWWHSTVGVVMPLLAAMHDRCTCGCQQHSCNVNGTSCAPSSLRLLFEPLEPLKTQLKELPHLKYSVVQNFDHSEVNVSTFVRADALVPDGPMGIGPPDVFAKARRMLSSLCGLWRLPSGGCGDPFRSSRRSTTNRSVLVISRCDAVEPEHKENPNTPHRRICVNGTETDRTFSQLRIELLHRGYEVRSMWPERLTMCEQFRRVAEADIVLYSHGSAMGSLVALSPGSTAIEIVPVEYLESPSRGLARCLECEKAVFFRREPPTCIAERHQGTNITRSSGGAGPQQPFARDFVAALLETLTEAGVEKLQHIPIPHFQTPTIETVHPWGCVTPATLAELAVAKHDALLARAPRVPAPAPRAITRWRAAGANHANTAHIHFGQ